MSRNVHRDRAKVVLVTGGASGVGRATALAFARQGAKVVVADALVEGGKETVHLIQEAGGEALFMRCDVAMDTEVAALIQHMVAVYGRLDCAINHARHEDVLAPAAPYFEEVWSRALSRALIGAWLCMKHEIPQMLQQGSGVVVNIAPPLHTTGFTRAASYAAYEHLIHLTKTAALQNEAQGIRVNVVCPGLMEAARPGTLAGAVMHLAQPEEVAEAVLWLCSDAASCVTGHVMLADGSYIA